ncbi:MAG TPA: homoserine O-acetyltransferase [Elusimicrobia bacterium]|nr:MAG: homoserine O-acetyltransferase [Elusimicrobia bacterium RIFOXYA12_FULL_49_49]OGS09863.1 MAG: homoserine O-acetyltransferase [Elusimicrobia bacterium RIFOXYA1_FULL_47_7]OGS15068.1 MAG: homoserine O-acetyltransferase [Elusimicrobia bacterium RIFOXYA2_FULL_47_53]OGS29406.1 MAG: homoserine O-acetyltransferase [Elusimicrobia bacterium RIFOXYB2_FULL_46_23]HBU69232.1 homoserine O-acetyltransferase [Elusimicrobiota bacterium]
MLQSNKESLGIVKPEYFTFAQSPDELILESGLKLGPITLAYETYGVLNEEKTNAILALHAFSGDAHAAGYHQDEEKPGWWNDMIGPGKAFDTDKYFVICSNVLGGCKGSTGPSSLNPATGRPYGLDFPIITISDMVRAQKKLIDHLGIKKLLCVAGGSMGGMQVLQWVANYPEMVKSAIPIATTMKHSPQQIAFDEVGRQAVMADPAWNGGDYYGKAQPERGLAVARMIGHITYMSDRSMEDKFSRKLKEDNYSFTFKTDFEVEGYLRYRGDTFVKRFDANTYLYITKAMDYFDVSGDKIIPSGKKIDTRFLVISFKSDWLYPSYQSNELVRILRMRRADVTYCDINSTYGHDAFLLEVEDESRLIKHFLEKVSSVK